MITFTHDKKRLRDHFEKDPVLFAYHLGDLDDCHFPHCQWATVYGTKPYIEDCILVYTGLDEARVLAFGLTERFEDLLREMVDLLPDTFFGHLQEPSLPILQSQHRYTPIDTALRMSLESFRPFEDSKRAEKIVRLDESRADELRSFYTFAYPGYYFNERMLATGKYFGYIDSGELVCVAGVHVSADEYKVAALGNIATHPDRRGEGLASLVTSHLVSELVSEGKRVCLNVYADNITAIECYERLGFVIRHEYLEGYFERGGQ